jgi:molybdate transport system substrate-binding protein
MKRIIIFLLLAISAYTAQAQKVNVAAAANLKYVLEEIKTEYVKLHPKAKVNLTFGASGMLVQQISNGANFDFFMAADNEFPLKLKDKGLTTGAMSTYAFGKLVIYSSSLDVEKMGLEALKNSSIKKIAIANPETATYGTRSVELLKSLKLYDQLKSKLVIGENIAQTAQFAYTGNAEIGFIALSLALAPDMAGNGSYYIISPKLYSPIEQACILIKTPVLNTEAAKFKKYVLSAATKAIWEKWGYKTIDN